MYQSLINNQVPKGWDAYAYPSLKPLSSWIKDLNERVSFIDGWLKGGNPSSYWISGLFYP
jgi:dynein heavy chain